MMTQIAQALRRRTGQAAGGSKGRGGARARTGRTQRTLLFLTLGVLAELGGTSLLAAPPADAAPKAPAARQHASGSDEASPPAELVVLGAQVVTMDAARPHASAVALREHRIVYVGDDAGAAALIGRRTRVVRGALAEPAATPSGPRREPPAGSQPITVLPGLIDAHAHLVGLGLSLRALDLRGLSAPSTIVQAVRLRVRELAIGYGSETGSEGPSETESDGESSGNDDNGDQALKVFPIHSGPFPYTWTSGWTRCPSGWA